jgi:hypothetical protein
MIWIHRKFGEQSRKETLKKVELSITNRSLKSKETEFSEPDSLHVDTVKLRVLNESFAPVSNDTSFRIMLIAKFIWRLGATIIDVESAFLHGDFTEEIYMNIPEGMNEDQDHCLQLQKTIYVLIQSVREFYENFILVLESIFLWKIIQIHVCCQIGMEKKSFSLAFMLMTVLSLRKKSASNGQLLS